MYGAEEDRLFGNHRALGEDFHITNDRAFAWDQIHTAIGRALGVEARNFQGPTDTLIRPAAGCGSGISPSVKTSLADPCFSYQQGVFHAHS